MMSNESKTQTTGCPKKEGLGILNIFDSYCLKEHLGKPSKQAERLKSRERRPEVDRLTGLLAQWLIGSMVDRLDG